MANVLGTLFTDIADSIRSKTGSTDKIAPNDFPAQIDSIQVGGGLPAGYYSVTFMSGDTVLFKRFVFDGEDCPDPLTQGRIETPTKESTAQYDYSYKGWSATENGTVDSSVLNNITEDKIIYAVYTESVRYYTITYYDTDGVTVVGTESLPYGATKPGIGAKKEGYYANGYIPEFTTVVGDASYTTIWSETVSFANGSWADIAAVCDSGDAAKHFTVGDTRTETIGEKDYTLEIIGRNHDTVYDTGVKTGITVWIKDYDVTGLRATIPWNSHYNHTTIEEGIFDLMNDELQKVVKTVRKEVQSGMTSGKNEYAMRLWSLSAQEINSTYSSVTEGTPYEKFSAISKEGGTDYIYDDLKGKKSFWTRSFRAAGAGVYVHYSGYIYYQAGTTYKYYILPCFCI